MIERLADALEDRSRDYHDAYTHDLDWEQCDEHRCHNDKLLVAEARQPPEQPEPDPAYKW